MILVPLYYQEVRHESVIMTGLLTGPRAGHADGDAAHGPAHPAFGGGRVALFASRCWRSRRSAGVHRTSTSILSISLVLLVRGIGIGFSFMPR